MRLWLLAEASRVPQGKGVPKASPSFQAKDVSTLLKWLKTSPENPKQNQLLQYAYFLQQAVAGNMEVLKKLEAAKSDDPAVEQAVDAVEGNVEDVITKATAEADAEAEAGADGDTLEVEVDPGARAIQDLVDRHPDKKREIEDRFRELALKSEEAKAGDMSGVWKVLMKEFEPGAAGAAPKAGGILGSPVQGKGFKKGMSIQNVLQQLPANLANVLAKNDPKASRATLMKYGEVLDSIANAAEKGIKTEDVEKYVNAFLGGTIIECLKTQ